MIQDTPIQKTLNFLSIIWLYSLGHWIGATFLLVVFLLTIRLWPKKVTPKPVTKSPARKPEPEMENE